MTGADIQFPINCKFRNLLRVLSVYRKSTHALTLFYFKSFLLGRFLMQFIYLVTYLKLLVIAYCNKLISSFPKEAVPNPNVFGIGNGWERTPILSNQFPYSSVRGRTKNAHF